MPSKTKKIRFMALGQIEGLMFNPGRPSGIRLHRSGRHALFASLIPMHPKDDPFGHRRGLQAKVGRSYEADELLFRFIDSLNSGVFIPYDEMVIKLPHIGSGGRELIGRDGTLAKGYSLSWKHYPNDLKAICERASEELTLESQRFIKLLMWFFNIDHVHNPIRHIALYCNTRGRNYHVVSHPGQSGGHWQNDVVWSETNADGFGPLWGGKSEEPLGHELFREAGSLVHSAPRSALLMLVSALESAIKSYISDRLPGSQWLLAEVPSPPVPKMLRQFVPTLQPARAINLSQWSGLKPILKSVTDLTEQRNRLTHRGIMEVSTNELVSFKEDVSDVLYILDYLRGEDWAINNVRKKTCRALNWPDPVPTQTQMRATMTVVDE